MLNNWKRYKLSDIGDIVGGGTPPTTNSEYYNGDISWITPRDLSNHSSMFISKGERSITELGLKNSSAKLMPEGSVLLTSRAPIGYLAIAENQVCTNQGFKSIVVNKNVVNNKFIYYLLKSNIDLLLQNASGSTFQEISGNVVKNLEFNFPPLPEQQSIASILSAIDDKIENNLAINKTLEEMAMALYKHWFVDFGPFQDGEFVESELGMIPKGWRIGKLEDLLEIKYGKDHKKLQDGKIPVYGSGGIMRYVNESLYDRESILIPRKGTLSNLFYVTEPFWSVDTMFYTKIKVANFGKYIFHFLKSIDLASMDVGSAVPSLTTELLKRIEIIIPPKNIIDEINELLNSKFSIIESNIKENQTLTQLRDTLLPKLISGELRLKEFRE